MTLKAEAHPQWKGEDALVGTIHDWMKANYPKKGECETCGSSDRKTDYASIGHTYTRNREDWLELCVPCHRKMDGITGAVRPVEVGLKISAAKKGKPNKLKGVPLSPEHRAKLSLAQKGRPQNPDSIARGAQTRTGRKHSPEHCQKISAALKGKSVSVETRARLAAAAKAQ